MEETTVQETTAQDDNTDTQETTLKIEPRVSGGEEAESETLSIEPRVVEGEVVEGKTEQASTESENGNSESTSETSSDTSTETTTATQTPSETNSMSIPFIGLSIIQCVIAFLLIVVVLQQSKSASGMTSSTMIGNGDNQSYWSQNKGRSKESKLARMTVILGVIFFIITITLGLIR